jgi:hypothetical protein
MAWTSSQNASRVPRLTGTERPVPCAELTASRILPMRSVWAPSDQCLRFAPGRDARALGKRAMSHRAMRESPPAHL